jgi:hypothetical protein
MAASLDSAESLRMTVRFLGALLERVSQLKRLRRVSGDVLAEYAN